VQLLYRLEGSREIANREHPLVEMAGRFEAEPQYQSLIKVGTFGQLIDRSSEKRRRVCVRPLLLNSLANVVFVVTVENPGVYLLEMLGCHCGHGYAQWLEGQFSAFRTLAGGVIFFSSIVVAGRTDFVDVRHFCGLGFMLVAPLDDIVRLGIGKSLRLLGK